MKKQFPPVRSSRQARPSGRGQTPALGEIVDQLRRQRERWRASAAIDWRKPEVEPDDLPSRRAVAGIVESLRSALFPLRMGPPDLRPENEDYFVGHTLDTVFGALLAQIQRELLWRARQTETAAGDIVGHAQNLVRRFGDSLPVIRGHLDGDILAAYERDPSARSLDEVVLYHPGIHALIHHRIAHQLHILGAPLLGRIVAQLAQSATGIDIHPAATVGAGLFIEHGASVVIGEGARIARNSTLRGDARVVGRSAASGHEIGRPTASHSDGGVALDDSSPARSSTDISERFGLVVRQLREVRGWSQEKLAGQAELNRSYLGEIERTAAMPSLASAAKLAQALEVPLWELVRRCESGSSPAPTSAPPAARADAPTSEPSSTSMSPLTSSLTSIAG